MLKMDTVPSMLLWVKSFIRKLPIARSEVFHFPRQIRDWSVRWFHKPLIVLKIARLSLWSRLEQWFPRLSYALTLLFQPRDSGEMAFIAEFHLGTRVLFVYNAHLEAHASDTQRAFQMQDMLHDMFSRVAVDDAVIILGDLNTELEVNSPIIKSAQEHGFSDALVNSEHGTQATHENNQKLDWILTKNLKIVSGSVFLAAFGASDHRPIVVEIEVL